MLVPAFVPEDAAAGLSELDDVAEGFADGLPVSTDDDAERESVR